MSATLPNVPLPILSDLCEGVKFYANSIDKFGTGMVMQD